MWCCQSHITAMSINQNLTNMQHPLTIRPCRDLKNIQHFPFGNFEHKRKKMWAKIWSSEHLIRFTPILYVYSIELSNSRMGFSANGRCWPSANNAIRGFNFRWCFQGQWITVVATHNRISPTCPVFRPLFVFALRAFCEGNKNNPPPRINIIYFTRFCGIKLR